MNTAVATATPDGPGDARSAIALLAACTSALTERERAGALRPTDVVLVDVKTYRIMEAHLKNGHDGVGVMLAFGHEVWMTRAYDHCLVAVSREVLRSTDEGIVVDGLLSDGVATRKRLERHGT